MEFHKTKYRGLFYMIYLTYHPLKAYKKSKKCGQKVENDGNFQIRQSETPKEKGVGFGRISGATTYATGVTKMGTLFFFFLTWLNVDM
jgi:hypothetical protein